LRSIFRHAALLPLEMNQSFLRESALPGKKSSRNPNISTHVNTIWIVLTRALTNSGISTHLNTIQENGV
jgi:hypothetical protein